MMDGLAFIQAGTAYLEAKFPSIASGLIGNDGDEQLLSAARQPVEYYLRCNGLGNRDSDLDALATLSFDFLRLHAKFLRTGRYRAQSSHGFRESLYDRPDRMNEYLGGLLLSYAFWPNHVRIFKFYYDKFLAEISSAANIVEIGVGHGLMAATAM